jgi:ABC-type bacteriocin/lantibiotic exporter with double-glycine peptidase domain
MLPESDMITTFIQAAVAPVFLLAGVAGMLNVFTGRLARIMDRLEKMDIYLHSKKKLDSEYKEDEKRLKRRSFLVKRMKNTNMAIFFGTATGLMVALVILTIFSSALFAFHTGTLVSIFFILAMLFLILSLVLFLREIYFTSLSVRVKYFSSFIDDDIVR